MPALVHSKLSASGAHRWMACPASIAMEADCSDPGSPYATEGTAAHRLAELCLRGGVNADAHLNEKLEGVSVDLEMVDAVQRYLDYIGDQTGMPRVEQRVDFSPWVPGGFGTADAVILNDDTAMVIDLKYGRGVKVEAEENPQAMLYALGVLNEYGFMFDCDAFKLVIVQPRLDHISEWTISRADLLAWGAETLKPAAALALSDNAPLNPGEKQCRFCKAKATCRALAEHNLTLASEGFNTIGEPLDLKQPAKLSNEELGRLIPQLNTLNDWARAVETYALRQLESGGDIPGYKLVAGRSIRQWGDERKAAEALRDQLEIATLYTTKLITPAGAEKLLGKGHPLIAEHAIKPEGKPALAPETDRRPALTINPAEGFSQVA